METTATGKTKSKSKKVVIIVVILISIVIVVALGWWLLVKMHVLGVRLPVYDEVLSPKVSKYLASQPRYGVSNPQVNRYYNYCGALIYGHDKEYIYSYMVCQEYGWFYHYNDVPGENAVKVTRSASRGTGWSSHLRLRYRPGTDFEIIGYDEPRNGSYYYEDVKKMFAPMGEIGVDQEASQEVADQLLERFRSEHADDPYPDKIESIYMHRNPKIIIGGEVE